MAAKFSRSISFSRRSASVSSDGESKLLVMRRTEFYDVVRKAYTKRVQVDREFQRKTNRLVQETIGTYGVQQVNEFIETLTTIAYRDTKKKGAFTLPGVGKLVLVKRKARKGRNPATGEEIQIKAKTVVKFRVAKACKDAILPPKK